VRMPSTLSLASVVRSRSLNETKKNAKKSLVVRRSKSDVTRSQAIAVVPPSPQTDIATG